MRLIADVWASFRRLPGWVQIWVALILVPVNMASLWFTGGPGGIWVAGLAVGALAVNSAVLVVERGLSKAMALPHLLIWTPLVLWLALMGDKSAYLWLLLAVDGLSLAFDYPDALKWLRGDRAVA